MAGHKTTHTQLERFRLIDSMLTGGNLVPFNDIQEALRLELRDDSFSDSTLRRDIRYMRDELGAPLKYNRKNKGWQYTKAYKLPSEGFTEEELFLLQIIKKLLEQHSSKDYLYKSFSELLQKIFPLASATSERFFIPARPEPIIEEGVTEKVIRAIRNNYMLDFNYYSKWEPDERHRKILPYQIVIDEGNLFLYGANIEHKELPRLFNLSKVHNVEVIKSQTFELPENFRFHEESEHGRFGAFQYDDYFDFKIEFTGDARSNIREFVWSDNQVIEENLEKKTTTLSFTSSQWIPIQKWLLSFGSEAKPLEPDWFVEEWKNTVKKMSENL